MALFQRLCFGSCQGCWKAEENHHTQNNLLGLAMGEGPWCAASMLGIYLKFCKFHDDVGQMVSLLCSYREGFFYV